MKKFDFKKIISYFNLHTDNGLSLKIYRDWVVILVCFVLLLISAIAVDSFVLYKIKKELAKEIEMEGKKITVLKEKNLDKIVEYLNQKEEAYQKGLSGFSVSDPSSVPVGTTTPKTVK